MQVTKLSIISHTIAVSVGIIWGRIDSLVTWVLLQWTSKCSLTCWKKSVSVICMSIILFRKLWKLYQLSSEHYKCTLYMIWYVDVSHENCIFTSLFWFSSNSQAFHCSCHPLPSACSPGARCHRPRAWFMRLKWRPHLLEAIKRYVMLISLQAGMLSLYLVITMHHIQKNFRG